MHIYLSRFIMHMKNKNKINFYIIIFQNKKNKFTKNYTSKKNLSKCAQLIYVHYAHEIKKKY